LGVREPKSKIEELFCRVPHGEMTAKNGSIPSRNKNEESICRSSVTTDRRTDRQSQRRKIIDS